MRISSETRGFEIVFYNSDRLEVECEETSFLQKLKACNVFPLGISSPSPQTLDF